MSLPVQPTRHLSTLTAEELAELVRIDDYQNRSEMYGGIYNIERHADGIEVYYADGSIYSVYFNDPDYYNPNAEERAYLHSIGVQIPTRL